MAQLLQHCPLTPSRGELGLSRRQPSHLDAIFLHECSNVGASLRFGTAFQRADRAIVLAAVTQCGQALQWADDALKGDEEVCLAAVASHGWALSFADDEIRNNPDVVAVAVQQHGDALVFASDTCRANRDVVLTALSSCGLALEDASLELRDDLEIVLAAVRNHGNALRFASANLRRDPVVVTAAVQSHGPSLRWAAPEWRQDRATVLAAVSQAGSALQEASLDFRADSTVVLAAVANDGLALRWTSAALKQSHEVVLCACSQNGDALACAGVALRGDWSIVAAAVAQAGVHALAWASSELRGYADGNNEDDDDGVVEEDEVGGSIVPLISGSAGRRRHSGKIGRGSGSFVSVCQEKLLAARAWTEAFLPGALPRARSRPRSSSVELLFNARSLANKRNYSAGQLTSPPSSPTPRKVLAGGDKDGLLKSPRHAKPRLESTGMNSLPLQMSPVSLQLPNNQHCNSLFLNLADDRVDRSASLLAEGHQCPLTKLGALDVETSTALKKLIADFAGIPRGRTLKNLHIASERLEKGGTFNFEF